MAFGRYVGVGHVGGYGTVGRGRVGKYVGVW